MAYLERHAGNPVRGAAFLFSRNRAAINSRAGERALLHAINRYFELTNGRSQPLVKVSCALASRARNNPRIPSRASARALT